MKPLFRITMSMACLALLLWGGVAVPAETSPAPESCEYLMGVVECYPLPPHGRSTVSGIVPSDQMDAALARAYGSYGTPVAQGEWVVPDEPMVAEAYLPEVGSWEYSFAMETGNLPSACADEPCPTEEFTIIEAGGLPYRLEVDFGGN